VAVTSSPYIRGVPIFGGNWAGKLAALKIVFRGVCQLIWRRAVMACEVRDDIFRPNYVISHPSMTDCARGSS